MKQKIVLYSTGCPKCTVLKKKLDKKGIAYSENSSVDEMVKLDITTVPVLSVDGERMDFSNAIKWVNERGLQ